MAHTAETIAAKHGISAERAAGILAFEQTREATVVVEGGTITPRLLHSNDRLAARRAELAAERAANPIPSNEDFRKMLAEIAAL